MSETTRRLVPYNAAPIAGVCPTKWIKATLQSGATVAVGLQYDHPDGEGPHKTGFVFNMQRDQSDGTRAELKFGATPTGCAAMVALLEAHGIVSPRIAQLEHDLAAAVAAQDKAEQTIDLWRDEFRRIAACHAADSEIKQLCDRAINWGVTQHHSLIEQRDAAVARAEAAERERDAAREALREEQDVPCDRCLHFDGGGGDMRCLTCKHTHRDNFERAAATADEHAPCRYLEDDGTRCVLQEDYTPRCPCEDYTESNKNKEE